MAKSVKKAKAKTKAKPKKKKSRDALYEECKEELTKLKKDAEQGLRAARNSLGAQMSGDEGDIAQELNDQRQAFVKRDMTEKRLGEIIAALKRIEEGDFGICEETGEDIEEKRLQIMPWTRYSREGAEIVEREQRRFGSRAEEEDLDVELAEDKDD